MGKVVGICVLMGFTFYVTCGFLLLQDPFIVLYIYCFIYNMMCGVFFWFCLSGVLCTTCVYVGVPFFSLKFSSVILLKICSEPLTWNSSPMPVIHRFDISQCPKVPEYLCVCVSMYHII